MKFDTLPLAEAVGAILAHSTRCGTRTLKKGLVLGSEHVAALQASGIDEVVAAKLGDEDVHEDEAAARAATTLAGFGLDVAAPFTGRANLIAASPGLVVLDIDRINRLNRIDESLTVATLPAYDAVEAGQMVATVKVIPFAAPHQAVEAWENIATGNEPALRIAAFRPQRIGLILTRTAATTDKMMDKTGRVLADRLAVLGSEIVAEKRCDHDTPSLAREIETLADECDMTLVYGASAITDRRDVIPAAIERAGGAVEHFGYAGRPGEPFVARPSRWKARSGPAGLCAFAQAERI